VPMHFSAYRADDGTKLWSFAAQTGVLAGPVSYEVDGEQYIAVVAGHRQGGDYYSPNYSRLLVFKLGGTAELPPPIEVPPRRLDPPAPFGTTAQLTVGEEKYSRFCSTCHGVDAQSGGMFPDLRYSPTLHSQEAFDAIVLGGALTENGMVSFARAITPEEAQAIRAFVTQRANEAKQREAAATQAAAPAQQGHGASN